MNATHQIPQSIRNIFDGMSISDLQQVLRDDADTGDFRRSQVLVVDGPCEMREAASARTITPAFCFTVEAQLDGIMQVVEQLETARPELFAATEKLRDLVENVQCLLNIE